jgi:hypothetical protein
MLWIAGLRAQIVRCNGTDARQSVTAMRRPDSINSLSAAAPINMADARPISSPGGKSIVLDAAPKQEKRP